MNGIISFDQAFALDSPQNFPTIEARIYFSYLVAPYWSDVDTRREGRVRYESYYRGDSPESDQQMGMVEDFLEQEEGVVMEVGWMLLASWEEVHPHGASADLERQNPYLESVISNYCTDIGSFHDQVFNFNFTYTYFRGWHTIYTAKMKYPVHDMPTKHGASILLHFGID